MSSDLAKLVREGAVTVRDNTVIIELICADSYGAQVFGDDIVQRFGSEGGLVLKLRGKLRGDVKGDIR